jgi:prepilin-type N-terminal cleavage/methylation domain-containing protein
MPCPQCRRLAAGAKRGFTLVEMLAVITIIGILASLISVAVVAAARKARVLKIVNEIHGLETALSAWKDRFGDYPPDFAGVNDTASTKTYNNSSWTTAQFAQSSLYMHLQNAFPRYGNAASWGGFGSNVLSSGIDSRLLDPSTALVFWLGGMPLLNTASTGSGIAILKQLNGFSANPGNPFDTNTSRIAPFFQFDSTRLQAIYYSTNGPVVQTTWPATNPIAFQYVPDLSGTVNAPQPYVYFSARTYFSWNWPGSSSGPVVARGYDPRFQYWPTYDNQYTITEMANVLSSGAITPTKYTIHVRPYFHLTAASTGITEWFNSDKFQIICTGLDGLYGAISVDSPGVGTNQAPRSNPGVPYAPTYTDSQGNGMVGTGHFDNITNFGVIEDIRQ